MAMNAAHGWKAIAKLTAIWDDTYNGLKQMSAFAEAKPSSGCDLFEQIEDENAPEEICVRVKPFVLNVPERANDMTIDLYIVISGRMTFDKNELVNNDRLVTLDFSTKAAYFR
ncbi:MAG: hypothetical protein HY273_07740, partial [Gammaproteobacteria bacterium]|nr:hypothetical protein [Gammaproteobacteria bacterium]